MSDLLLASGVGNDDSQLGARHWETLEELRLVALDAGCSPAAFENALRLCDSDPFRTATYVQLLILGG